MIKQITFAVLATLGLAGTASATHCGVQKVQQLVVPQYSYVAPVAIQYQPVQFVRDYGVNQVQQIVVNDHVQAQRVVVQKQVVNRQGVLQRLLGNVRANRQAVQAQRQVNKIVNQPVVQKVQVVEKIVY